ncbi:metallophosphoesterase family protein [Spirillospora sp. CA-128828]|uniref:metallophosphoesterase family protein n=1 Tax=Spirillospora sp. CA-128828 TaxID=3240033 RepID=UPI003D8E04CC
MNGRPRSVAVIGDAGCEVTSSTVGAPQNQDCQKNWPFQPLSMHAASQSRPDLVVHVGDYVYREQPEGADDATPGCDAQGQAADWACLIKDFLRPAEALLAEAPLIFARGNHEDCKAGMVGRGAEWFRYFATVPRNDNKCFTIPQTETEPAQINAGTLHFILFDSSSASDGDQPDKSQAREFAKRFDEVNALAANVRLVLSGHVHLYQMLDFLNSTRPPQLTVGSSGTTLDTPPDDTKVMGQTVDGQTVQHSVSHGMHGYALLRDTGGQWHLTFHESSGQAWPLDCVLSTGPTKEFTCK